MSSRIDDFRGSVEEYVAFLEHEVRGLRDKSVQRTQGTLNPSPGSGAGQDALQTQAQQDIGHQNANEPITIVQYEPDVSLSPQKRRLSSADSGSQSTWTRDIDLLVRATPRATHWSKAIADTNLLQTLTNGDIVEYLLDRRRPPLSLLNGSKEEQSGHDAAARLRSYGRCFFERRASVSLAKKLVNFQEFLFLSACVVLLETGAAPSDDIVDISRLAIGIKSSDRYCKRILDAAIHCPCQSP